ncbi:hypothetical protein [Streptomyces sp. RTd22]|uniref:hypothetical protein n=1 Tax=Streptomyces sp. RTd22 TaxID=1841249 RepID=UPI0007C5287C|nr:hypothetical protein [Streptomyces sp. RTd22]
MAMDYPYLMVSGLEGEMAINITVAVRSDTSKVTPQAIADLIRDYLQTIDGVENVTASRSEITQTSI